MGGDFFAELGLVGEAPSLLPALRPGLCFGFIVKPPAAQQYPLPQRKRNLFQL
jgi:hypothetical protein